MGRPEAGISDARDDFGGGGRLRGIPVVADGFGDAAEFDDGEFGGEPALEGVDAPADLGDGHGIASAGSFTSMEPPEADVRQDGGSGMAVGQVVGSAGERSFFRRRDCHRQRRTFAMTGCAQWVRIRIVGGG